MEIVGWVVEDGGVVGSCGRVWSDGWVPPGVGMGRRGLGGSAGECGTARALGWCGWCGSVGGRMRKYGIWTIMTLMKGNA